MSSALTHYNCRAACRAHLLTCDGLPLAGGYAYEGFSYTPERGSAFVEDSITALDDNPVAHGAIDHKIGYILTLKYPQDAGTEAIEKQAGKLLDHFKVGLKLTYGGETFLSYGAKRRGKIVHEPDWQILTVAVELQTFTLE